MRVKSLSEVFHFQNSWWKLDWSIVNWSVKSFAIDIISVSESDESVYCWGLSFKFIVSNDQESSNDVNVNKDAVVSLWSWGVWGRENWGTSQIVPVLVSNEGIDKSAFLIHILFDIESSVSVGVFTFLWITTDNWDRSIIINSDLEFFLTQLELKDQWVNLDRFVKSSTAGSVSVSESDESVNLSSLFGLIPGCDDQKGSNDVSVNDEEQEWFFGVNAWLIEVVSTSQIIPVGFLQEFIDCWEDDVEGNFSTWSNLDWGWDFGILLISQWANQEECESKDYELWHFYLYKIL